MSFFGFDQNNLEDEKRRFMQSGRSGAENEDLAVYTWGEESYDGLGDVLQEGEDDLNYETFGGTGAVGKDFDFSKSALPLGDRASHSVSPSARTQARDQDVEFSRSKPSLPSHSSSRAPPNSLESIWDDKSPFALLPKANGSPRHPEIPKPAPPPPATSFSPFSLADDTIPGPPRDPAILSIGNNNSHGVRTLEEIEAEMREAFAAQRNQNISPSQGHQALSQAQLRTAQQPAMVQTQRQQLLQQHAPTPPPRMHPHSQSPRFHQQQQQHQIYLLKQQQQRQLLELQEQRKRQEQVELLELQEQLRLEELERQVQLRARQQAQELRAQQQIQLLNSQLLQHHRSSPVAHGRLTPLAELQQQQRRHGYGRQSPASLHLQQQIQQQQQQQVAQEVPFQQALQYLPREIQLQQRLLAEMAQAEFMSSMQGSASPPPLMMVQSEREIAEDRELQDVLRAEAMKKIMEAEKMEEKRRRKLEKIRYMSRYNDLMTQSDKDFITRIQVSQLVTQDPYADDFYAQVYGAVMRTRMGIAPTTDNSVLKFGASGGVGLGLPGKPGGGRRPNAMQRMEQQVERIVNNARLREKEKGSLNSLQGALGKTSGRSYKAAPRQLLQVDPSAGNEETLSHATGPHSHISKTDAKDDVLAGADVAAEAAKIGREALGGANDSDVGLVRKEPITRRQSLVMLERIYDHILDLEQQRRTQPNREDEEALIEWEIHFDSLVDKLWDSLQVLVPLDTSDPHPFISLLTPVKGKKMLPRVTRHFNTQQSLTLLTLLVACFSQLDVVVNSHVLDHLPPSGTDDPQQTLNTNQQKEKDEREKERTDVDNQTQAFLGSVMQALLPIAANASLRLVSGILGVFVERNELGLVARTRPGIAMLTMFLSRVEVIKQSMATASDVSELPSPEETEQWQAKLQQLMFDHLFQLLSPHLVYLFPSVRQSLLSGIPTLEIPDLDTVDQPTWQFLAALALNASLEQQQVLVTSLRDRVLENVASVNKGWVADEEQTKIRLGNVNIFLHAIGLDSSQIAL